MKEIQGGHPLKRLGPYLVDILPEESNERVLHAVALLDAARRLRVAGQHSTAQQDALGAYDILGLAYPVADWSAAWARIQTVVTNAIDAIRDELQATAPAPG